MNIRTILPGVYYTGVNDRTTHLFEGLWPLPNGVSYNSYLVAGDDKIALIDCVSIGELREFTNNLKAILGDRKPDYLIVNHMEPDHSGSIPEIVEMYPDIKIVGNSQTIGMIGGFYHITDTDRFLEVKEGATVDLGGKHLRFHLVPMVHWPETMVTYLEEDKLLFSGDAFGTFGALNGGVVDDEMEVGMYIDEMYRYYSNIVGKYGKFVQRALQKLAGVEVEYICPTHGPVWHSHLKEVWGLVDRLSSYEPEAGVTIIYGSMYGNTGEMAEIIARELASLGVKNIKVHNASVSPMSVMISDAFRYEGLIVGCSTYSMRLFPPVETFMNAMETREIKNKVFATFGSFTWAKGIVVAALQDYASRMGMPVVSSLMMKQSASEENVEEAKALAAEVVRNLKHK